MGFFGLPQAELPLYTRLRREPAKQEDPTLLGSFPGEEALRARSRCDPGDTFKALRQWSRGLSLDQLSEAGALLSRTTRRETLRFLMRMCERRFYSAQSRELLCTMIQIASWVEDGVVTREVVVRALGAELPAGHAMPDTRVAREAVGDCENDNADSLEGRSTSVVDDDRSLSRAGSATRISDAGNGGHASAATEAASPTAGSEHSWQPERARESPELYGSVASSALQDCCAPATSPMATPPVTRPLEEEATDAAEPSPPPRLPQAQRERPAALATFPPLKAFTDPARFDAGDTFKHLRQWVAHSTAWDLAAVAEWLEEEQRRDIIKFLTRVGEERRLYQSQSREVLSKLLAVKEWVNGERVVDEDAITECFYHVGATPQIAWSPTPVISRQSTAEYSLTSLADSADDAPLRFGHSVLPPLPSGSTLSALGEEDKEDVVSECCKPAVWLGERPREQMPEPQPEPDSQAFAESSCTGNVVVLIGAVALATWMLSEYRRRR